MKLTKDQLLSLKEILEDGKNGYFDEDFEDIVIEVEDDENDED